MHARCGISGAGYINARCWRGSVRRRQALRRRDFHTHQYFKTRRIAHLDGELALSGQQRHHRNIKPKDIEDMLFAMEKMLRFVAQHPGDEPRCAGWPP
ncbi:hypothetical protein M8494_31965 [Serratia ureilytica]